MASYKLVTYQSAKGPRAGVVIGETVYDAAELVGRKSYATMLDILDDWRTAQGLLAKAAAKPPKKAKGRPLGRTKLLVPVMWPSAIYCAGANYTDHVAEMARAQNIEPEPDPHTLGLKPWHFIKATRAAVPTQTTVELPAYSKAVDWEVELGAVIGRNAKDVPLEKALDVVAGYTIGNDLSARDAGRRPHIRDTSPFKYDWLGQKCFDMSCPLGPWIVPAKEIKDPQKLALKLWVNGVIKQDSNTSEMIFTLAEQIAQLSSRMTLYPGDIVLTGTPAGVGAGRREFLKPGDTVKCWVEGVGELVNKMA